jgi:hypothetical protein
MSVNIKTLQKLAAKKETLYGSYTAPDVLIPFKAKEHKQAFSMIEDESIVGVAQKDLPMLGVRKFSGNLDAQIDKLTMDVIFEAAFGANSSGTFTVPTTKNEISLSLCALDAVKTNKYAGVVINNFQIKSEAEKDLSYTCDLLSNVAETRDDTAFPTINTSPGARFGHHMAGGASGYIRIGDQADDLAAGDNQTIIKALTIGLNWNFKEDFVNAVGSLQPLSGICEPSLSIELAEHSTDAFKAWRDAGTGLQLEAYWYIAATGTLKIQVPNFLIEDIADKDGDKIGQTLKCRVGRNGTGTSYTNARMAFVSPIKAIRVQA